MTEESKIHLSVLSDDFGMCPEVNDGIVEAFTNGLLTDANIMAPCPSFGEAARMAKDLRLPVGMHATFTAEWDRLRWGPLTSMKSMVRPDGTFRDTVEEAWKDADVVEAEAEFEAQWKLIESKGIKITHACEHMGAEAKFAGIFSRKLKQKKVPYRDFSLDGEKWGIPHYRWDSVFTSSMEGTELVHRKGKLTSWLKGLGPGYHIWHLHSALDKPSLSEIAGPGHPAQNWTRLYRALDQALVTDPEVADLIEKRGILRVSMCQCPVVGF